jgi:hypothetical protein
MQQKETKKCTLCEYCVNILFCNDLNRFEIPNFVMLFVRTCVHFVMLFVRTCVHFVILFVRTCVHFVILFVRTCVHFVILFVRTCVHFSLFVCQRVILELPCRGGKKRVVTHTHTHTHTHRNDLSSLQTGNRL